MFKPHPAQEQIVRSNSRIRVATCGRRFGKTLMGLNEVAHFALKLKPNTVSWWVAPTYDISQIAFRMGCAMFKNLFRKEPSLTERCLSWINGGKTYFRSTDKWQHLVGEGLSFLVVDEAGRVPELAWQESLRPALIDYQGSALILGTPKGKNWFYREWLRGQDNEFPEYKSWKLPTHANPYIDPAEIEMARLSMPAETFKQEFMAEFLDRAAGVFRGVDSCIKPYQLPLPPVDGCRYFAGLDLAKYQDFTVLTIFDQAGKMVFWDRFHRLDWELQLVRISPVVKKYNARVMVDSTGVGDPIFERLYRERLNVVPYKFTNESKKRLIEQLILGIEQGQITFPNIPELLGEIDVFEYELGPTGTIRYNAPSGYHDDCVISLALAWEAMGGTVQEGISLGYQSVGSRRMSVIRGAY